jgi:hypothetical protein
MSDSQFIFTGTVRVLDRNGCPQNVSIEATVSKNKIIAELGRRAAKNTSGKAAILGGAVVVRKIRDLTK